MTTATYQHTASDLVNFERRVQHADGDACWLWTGATFDERGYGCFTLNRKAVRAHRFAFFVANGCKPLPDRMEVMHSCDNPSCVRPTHLTLGTNLANVHDRDAKGRTARGKRSGSAKLTEANVIAILSDERGARPVAAEYGVARSLVQRIRQRKHWRHLNEGAVA